LKDFKELNDDNFVIYAVSHYNNPQCKSIDEFNEDLLRIVYIKRLVKKYLNGGELRERLIINHIITLYNVFDIEPATKILLFKLEENLLPVIKSFLVYLNYIKPDNKSFININMDDFIVNKLRNL
jgi:hypothetical protein